MRKSWIALVLAALLIATGFYGRRALLLHLRAYAGNADAQYALGWQAGEKGSYATAFHWYSLAAAQGHSPAEVNLGNLYLKGQGIPADPVKAVEWYQKAADQGDRDGEHNVGAMYYDGTGVQKSLEKAAFWHRKAAEDGDLGSQIMMGVMYVAGNGVAQDLPSAYHWFSKAAEQGDAKAQYTVCADLLQGQGVLKVASKAIIWCERAAEQGFTDAQITLGDLYQSGTGTKQNPERAYFWLQAAVSAQGSSPAQADAAKRLVRIGDALSDAKKRNIDAQVSTWRKAHPSSSADDQSNGSYVPHREATTNPDQIDSVASQQQQSASAAQTSGGSASDSNRPLPTNCHDNPAVQALISRSGPKNKTTREDYAERLRNGSAQFGISVMAAGDDGEYLMFVAPAANEDALRRFVATGIAQKGDRLGICEEGFAGVQFVVKDPDGSQRLLRRSETTYQDIVDYYRDHMASPM